MLNLREFRTKAKGLADLLNYAAVIEDGIVLNKDGSFMAAWSYSGDDLDSATAQQLSALSARVNAVLARFGSGWMAHIDVIRKPALAYVMMLNFPDRTTRLIDHERRLQYETEGAHFESHYVLTLTYMPPAEVEVKLASFFVETTRAEQNGGALGELANFKSALTGFEDGLFTDLRLRRLRSVQSVHSSGHPHRDDEFLRHLNTCITGSAHPVSLPPVPVYLDCILGSQDFYGDLRPRIRRMHIRPISIVGYPAASHPGMLDFLHRLPLAYRWSTRFIFLDPTVAEKHISSFEKKWFQRRKSLRSLIAEQSGGSPAPSNAFADAMAGDAQSALAEASSGAVKFGYCTSVVLIMDEDPAAADAGAREVLKVINGAGFNARLEDVNAVEAYLGSLPGHGYANVRRPLMHSLNVADLLPLTTIWPGPERNPCPYYPRDSSPLAYAATNGATPFRLSLHVSDVGHTLVVGPTGAGKSTLLGFLMAQHFRYAGAQVFAFDKGYSAFALCKASGGEHYDIAGEHGSLSFYPLGRVDEASERAWAAEWLETLGTLQGLTLRPHHRKALARALGLLGEGQGRTITDLVSTLQDHELRDSLAHYTLSGAMGSLLDADQDGLGDDVFQVFEMDSLLSLGPKNVVPVLLYLFHRIEQRLTGQPTLIVLDEAWLLLLNSLFEEKIRDWLKTLRKANAAVVFATHSPTDILQSRIASAVVESCPTKILLPNLEAANAAVASSYAALGVAQEQIDIIVTATPKRQYYYISPLGKRLFDLGLGDVALSFLGAGGKEDVAKVRGLIETYGDVWPAVWLDSRGLSDAAETWLHY
ncbi:MAG: transporter [Candidatus Eremiobacteraeota bacterium]|nr:transporter [Candidatus Eremiobacteraeota bacterium]